VAKQEMSIKQIKEVINFSLEASRNAIKLPICLWGNHGIGKTELVKQIAIERDYNLVVLHLATQDICDLIGIPAKHEFIGQDGEKEYIQVWSVPQWLHNASENSKKTGKPNLFFLDEFNRGNRFVLAAMLPFLIEGVLHTHRIGINDAVIAAANPPTEQYEVSEIIDEAMLNRLGHVCFKPTHTEYIDFLKRQHIDKTTLKVVANNPGFTKISDFELGFNVDPSRRSIFNVMSLLGKKPRSWVKEHASYVLEAYLGSGFRDEWLSEYSNKDESITLEMLKDFDANKADIENALRTEIDGQKTHRTDILSKTLDIIKVYIKDNRDTVTHKDVEWMTKFFDIAIIPEDACASVFMSNPDMKMLIMKDAKINIKLTNFLRRKKILTEDGIAPWAANCDKEA
jgi:alkaline phosphatase D